MKDTILKSVYKKLIGYDIQISNLTNVHLLYFSDLDNYLKCLIKCNLISDCQIVMGKTEKCFYFKREILNEFLNSSEQILIWEKILNI